MWRTPFVYNNVWIGRLPRLVKRSKPLNLFAAQSLERVAALSDGLFAFAMTLIVLDVRVPAAGPVHSERDLWVALVAPLLDC